MIDTSNMSLKEIRELTAQLEAVRKAGLAQYNKGDLILEESSKNKGGGISLRFKGSRFPVNLFGSQLSQIVKHGQAIIDKAEELGIEL